jgi:ribose/xylose/arabinose/galactoside ABC-type transport system permease subunit
MMKKNFSLNWNLLGRFAALLLVFVFFAVLVEDGRFISPRNLENILRQSAVYGTAGVGMTLVIITAGIDLSVGSIIALSVVMVAACLDRGLSPFVAMLGGVGAATLAGAFNGQLITRLKLVPFIVTLGTMGMIRGLAKGLSNERDIYPKGEETWLVRLMDPVLTNRNSGGFLLPTGVWIMLACMGIMAFVLRYTRFGRHVFAVGSNAETARLCGVNVGRTTAWVYALSGLFCGIAGLMQFAYIGGIGQPTTAAMYELFVIAAVVIGGASFTGGEGSILGTFLGALTITMLYMGGQQMGWEKWKQEMVIGGIIILAVAVDRFRHRRASNS